MNNVDLDIAMAKAIELDNSELFDVHTWSAYSEVNQCVDYIYTEFINNSFNENRENKIRKKHIKVIILDLYVKWLKDPTMYSSFYLAKWYYDDLEGRYNKLHISKVTPKVVDTLEKLEYIHPIAKGHNGRRSGKKSRISRMRATDKLIDLIVNKHRIKPEMIERFPTTECIILRDYDESKNRQVNIPYEDNPQIKQWRIDLCAYNNLLRKTFIDIPMCPSDGIPTKSQDGKTIKISQHEKFVSRIFNNGNWENGGRFYGGYWQRIPSEWRTKIHIFNLPVIEVDYSGLHIVLLYAKAGITYRDDPYRIEGLETSERMRELLKSVLLASINAEDKDSARKAVQREINFNPDEFGWVKNEGLNLSDIIDAFANKHSPIKEYFFSGSGIRLQHIDSIIAEKVINHFTQKNVAVLCIHDSFIITADKLMQLQIIMDEAFVEVMRKLGIDYNHEPKTSLKGGSKEQWGIIIGHPELIPASDSYLKNIKYDYPEWYGRMESFKQQEFEDYYVPEADFVD